MSTLVEVGKQVEAARVNVGPQGRIVIPIELRRTWNLEQGEVLVARLVDDTLVMERPAAVLERIKRRFAHLKGGPSLADELIADRRREAAREDAESA